MFRTNIYNNILSGTCGDATREACEGGGMYIGGHGGRSRASTVYMEDCNVINNTASSYAEAFLTWAFILTISYVLCMQLEAAPHPPCDIMFGP